MAPVNPATVSTSSRPSYTAAAQSAPQSQRATHRLQQQPQQLQTQRRKQRPVIVGRSRSTATSRAGNSSHITAAKPYISKASFCIDNVSTDVSELAMAKFVAAMDIDVLGCYSVKLRQSPYQRMHGIEPQDRKAFRYVFLARIRLGFWMQRNGLRISLFPTGYLRRNQLSQRTFMMRLHLAMVAATPSVYQLLRPPLLATRMQ